MGELTFPPNADSGDHAHGAIEMFYVLSGSSSTSSMGRARFSNRGWSGTFGRRTRFGTRPGPAGAKVVVIWVPGDGEEIAARWTKEP